MSIVAVEINVPAARVASDLINFPMYVDLAALPDVWWDALAFWDGRDIRVTDTDSADIPFDLVAIDQVAKTGSLFAKTTLSATDGATIVITCGDNTRTAVAVDAANGRNAVWADYASVYLPTYRDGWVDHTGNASKLTQDKQCTSLEFNQLASADNMGHQGVATDGTYFYMVDTNAINKFDTSWTLITSNTQPNTDAGVSTDHCGGPVVVGTTLYIPIAGTGGTYISRWHTSDLSFIDAVAISEGPAGLGYNSDDGFLYGCDYGGDCTTFWKYNLDDLTLADTITLSEAVPSSDGMVWWRGYWWFSSEDTTTNSNGATKRLFQVAADGTVVNVPVWMAGTSSFDTLEGACVGTDDRLVLDLTKHPYRLNPVVLTGGAGGGIHAVVGGLTSTGTSVTSTFTMGATVNFTSFGGGNQAVVSLASGNFTPYVVLKRFGTDGVWGVKDSTNGWLFSTTSPSAGTSYRLTVTYNGSSGREIFQNGTSIIAGSGITAIAPSGAGFWVAKGLDGQSDFEQDVVVGYAYLRHEVLTSDWLAAEHSNLFNPTDFYTVGATTTGISQRNFLTGSGHTVSGNDNVIAGSDGTITGSKSVLFSLNGSSNTLAEDGKFKVAGKFESTGTTTVPTPSNSTDAATKAYVDANAGITQLTGDVTAGPGSGSQAATLANSGATAGTYGDSTHTLTVTVDSKGRVTSISEVVSVPTGTGTFGLLVEDGVTSPPSTLYTEDGTDWLYADGE